MRPTSDQALASGFRLTQREQLLEGIQLHKHFALVEIKADWKFHVELFFSLEHLLEVWGNLPPLRCSANSKERGGPGLVSSSLGMRCT